MLSLTQQPQQSKDVEAKLKDLIPWLTQLRDNLTKANSDPEEAERREQLKLSVLHLDHLLW